MREALRWFSAFLIVYSCEPQSVRSKISIQNLNVTEYIELYWICVHWVPPMCQARGQVLTLLFLQQHSDSYLLFSPSTSIWNPILVKCFWFLSLVQTLPQRIPGPNQSSPFESHFAPPVLMEQFSTYTFPHHFISIHCVSTIRLETPFEHGPVLAYV